MDGHPTVGGFFGAIRGLRMRLTLSYVLFFALILASIGFIFGQALNAILHQQSERVLDEEWSALKGFLKLESGAPVWGYDPEDPDETYTVERLRRLLLLTDTDGNVLEISNGYSALGQESKEQIQEVLRSRGPITVLRSDGRGGTYMVRQGTLRDQDRQYFLAIGLAVGDTLRVPDRFMRVYFLMMPIMLLAIVVLGWFAAGQALQPLQQVAQAAQVVSAGNLGLRLPLHGTGDELDGLIQTFNSMMERLAHSFEQVRQFSLDASHELRTPITAIRGQLEVALLTAQTNEQYREAIETALQDVEKLAKIVKTLLLLAQAESGQVGLQKTTVDLSEAVEELANQFRLIAEEKNISIRTELPPACPVEADRVQFDRLLSNLLSNAVKYTQNGGEVRVTLGREDGQALLTVTDNGPGIPAQHLPHVFERFYRVRRGEHDPEKGVGLGLAFVAWIVKAHGGRIEASSDPGQGTAFRVWLPEGTPSARPVESLSDSCTD